MGDDAKTAVGARPGSYDSGSCRPLSCHACPSGISGGNRSAAGWKNSGSPGWSGRLVRHQTIMKTGLVLLVPAYQPSPVLPEIISAVTGDQTECIDSVVVVDDGSGPDYCETFRQLASLPGVTVLRHAVNLGVGAALKTGFNYILVKWPEALGIV